LPNKVQIESKQSERIQQWAAKEHTIINAGHPFYKQN